MKLKSILLFLLCGLAGIAQNNYVYYDTVTVGCGNLRLVAPIEILDNEGVNSSTYTISTIPYVADSLTIYTQLDPDNPTFSSIALGFNFYFFNALKKYIQIDENNFITFNGHAGTDWPIQPVDTNSTNFSLPPRNSIMAPWMILEQYSNIWGNGHGTIRYGVKGTAPFRRYIVEFNDVGTICMNDYFSGRTIIYETTNVVETHIRHKPMCNQFGEDLALHGLLGINLFKSAIVQGRNATEWTADYEGTRFTPYDTLYLLNSVNWFNDQNQLVAANDTLVEAIGLSENYMYVARYINAYGGDTITVTKHYHVNVDTGNLQVSAVNAQLVNNTITTCGKGTLLAAGMDYYLWRGANGDTLRTYYNDFNLLSYNGDIEVFGLRYGCVDSITVTVNNTATMDTTNLLLCQSVYDTLYAEVPGDTWLNYQGDTITTSDSLIIIGSAYPGIWEFYNAVPDGQCINYHYYTVRGWLELSYNTVANTLTVLPEGPYYNWYFNDILIPGQHGNVLPVNQTGQYKATSNPLNGCGTISTYSILAVGIDENKYTFDMYPNPATSIITIDISNFSGQINNVKFYNLQGQMVLSRNYTGNTIDVGQLANGAYLLQLITTKGVLSKMVIIEQ